MGNIFALVPVLPWVIGGLAVWVVFFLLPLWLLRK